MPDRKAQSQLEINYDLQSKDGLHRWLEHYAYADPATRAILMGLWRFEPRIDETDLIDAAASDENAKVVLADLSGIGIGFPPPPCKASSTTSSL